MYTDQVTLGRRKTLIFVGKKGERRKEDEYEVELEGRKEGGVGDRAE